MSEAAAILDPAIGWALLAFFSVGWVTLGVFWGRKAKGLEGHMLAGRNVGLALGTATAVATWVTSNTTMLAPQFALQLGVWGMLAYSTAAFGLLLFAPLAERIQEVMPKGFSSAEFFRVRYGKAAWVIFMLISLFYALTWLMSMAMAGGLLLESLSGIPYRFGMTVILAACTLYTVFGGLKAVIGTDFVQSLVILVGILIVGFVLLSKLSLGEVYQDLESHHPALLDMLLPVALMALFNNLLFGIGEIFHSNVWWSRAFAFRKGIGRKAYMLGGLIWLPIPVVAGFIAMAASKLGVNIPHVNMVGPLVTVKLLGTVGALCVFIIVFSSIASSVDSLLAATSDLVTKEVLGVLWKRKEDLDHRLEKAAPRVIVALALVTWGVCLTGKQDLASLLFRAGPLVGSLTWPIVAGLYWSKTNRHAVIAAMVAGSATGLWAHHAWGWYTAALVGTAVSMVLTLVGSAMRPQDFSWARAQQSAGSAEAQGI